MAVYSYKAKNQQGELVVGTLPEPNCGRISNPDVPSGVDRQAGNVLVLANAALKLGCEDGGHRWPRMWHTSERW